VDKANRLDELIDGAEELLTNLTDAHDPEIQKLRDRVDAAIAEARRAIATPEEELSVKVREIARTVDDYVRDYPWLAFATGVLVAGTIAFIVGSATGSKKRPIRG